MAAFQMRKAIGITVLRKDESYEMPGSAYNGRRVAYQVIKTPNATLSGVFKGGTIENDTLSGVFKGGISKNGTLSVVFKGGAIKTMVKVENSDVILVQYNDGGIAILDPQSGDGLQAYADFSS